MNPHHQVAEANFDWLMDINFHGLVRMTRAFLPLLRTQPEARIVNISSVFGLIAPPEQTAYASAKFAVRGFSHALRHELATRPACWWAATRCSSPRWSG